MKKFIQYLSLGLIAMMTFVSCSDVQLQKVPKDIINTQSKGSFCTFDPDSAISYTNFLFIIDFSGSNSSEGTDPKKARVRKAMEFYEQFKDRSYTRWGMIAFDDDAEAIIKGSGKRDPVFTDDQAIISAGFNNLKGKSHSGSTNYSDAIDLAAQGIDKNNQIDPSQKNYYAIFFLTDGMPNKGATGNALYKKVSDLSGDGTVYLSAGYYGGSNPNAEKVVQKMAEAGKGKFMNFDDGEKINFNDLLVGGETRNAWILKKDTFFVYNLNSAICEDLKYDVDSDADGLCDKDELKYNLNPRNRSTPQKDPNGGLYETGYSDYFYYITVIKGKRDLPKCLDKDRIDEDLDLLNNCEEALLVNQNPIGTEWPQGTLWTTGNPLDPDTDNDGVIDGLEAVVFRNHLGWALDNRINQHYDSDKEIAFRQIQLHRNPLEDDPKVDIEYDSDIKLQNDVGDGRACYDFSQNKLKLYPVPAVEETHPLLKHGENENIVLVYFIQTKFKDPNGKGIYMTSFQKLKADGKLQSSMGSAAGLKVNNSVFTPYEVYKKLGN